MDPEGSEYDDVEIVVISSSDFKFLQSWQEFFAPYPITALYTGEGSKESVKVPEELDIELLDLQDIERRLGPRAWIFGTGGAAARSFAYLFCKARFVYTLEEGSFVGRTPDGELINALSQHVRNLLTPSTPFFFNTLYDPYCKGSDFVRGYPFTLRQGVPTALSHGLWNNAPDYDAPTRMCKPLERNDRYVDAVMTVPKGTLFPMSGRNVAFDRHLIGSLMYCGMSVKDAPPFFYPDMWAGWASKVICDHLGLGVKTGLPYIFSKPPESPPLGGLETERPAMLLQEEIIPFFQNVALSPESNTPELCYVELADKVKDRLSAVDPFFDKLADAMRVWIELWAEYNPGD